MAKIGDIKSVGNGFRFRFTCPITGKIQSRKNQNQAELEKIKARLISDIDTGFYQQKVREAQAAKGKEKTTFITAVRAYEKERERDFARGDIQRSTLDTYLTQLRRLKPLYDLDCADLTTHHFQEIIDELPGKSADSPATQRTRKAHAIEYKRLQVWLVRHGYTATKFDPLKTGQKRKKVMWVPQPGEVQKVIEAAQGKWRAMIALMATTGLRQGEVRALAWDAVDFDRQRIFVKQAVKKAGKGGAGGVQIDLPKRDASVRTLSVSEGVLNLLKAMPNNGDLIFGEADGTPVDPNKIRFEVTKAIKRSGVEWRGSSSHTFRHFACSLFMQEFSNPKKVQQLMGHASITVTMDIYTHLFKEDEDARDGNRIAGRLGL